MTTTLRLRVATWLTRLWAACRTADGGLLLGLLAVYLVLHVATLRD
jgi:hypothetical protein